MEWGFFGGFCALLFASVLLDFPILLAPFAQGFVLHWTAVRPVPWSIAGAVPLATLGASPTALLAACYLYLIPLWNLHRATRKQRAA